MNRSGTNRWLVIVAAFLVGLLVGWIVLGWWLFPVSWSGATLQDVTPEDKAMVLEAIAAAYQADPNPQVATERLQALGAKADVEQLLAERVQLATTEGDLATVNQINSLAAGVGLTPPSGPIAVPGATPTPPAEETGGGLDLGTVCLAGLGIAAVVGGIALALWLLANRRKRSEEPEMVEEFEPADEVVFEAGPTAAMESSAKGAPAAAARGAPLMQTYSATFVPGDPNYDDTFSIEAGNAGYLGECGLTISEMIGGDPNRVTALEVWLFDKSDIRTVTKVLMSDYAYGNPSLREKLSSRGDAVLARPGAAFVLDAQTLRLEGEVKSLEYAEGDGPARGAFRRLTVDLRVSRQAV
jgi:hypothetical protein